MLKEIILTLKEASKIMLNATDIQNKTEVKGSRNFVTEYDKKVESFLRERLHILFPDVVFIGEESNDNLSPYENKCFICDPIDGTANFRRSYKYSAISIAYVEYGKVIAGAVLNPYLDEVFFARRGKGAFLNGERIFVSNNDLKNSIVSFGTAPYYPELSNKTTEVIQRIMPDVEDIRRTGSAALDLCYVACGRNDFFFELALSPWDFAGASVIIEEAGGIITNHKKTAPVLDNKTPIFAGNKIAYNEFFEKNYII